MFAHTDVLFSGAISASGDTSATPVITKYEKEAIIYLDITAVSGTNPTLDLAFKTYDELSGKWFPLATFTRKITTGQDCGFIEYGLNSKIAVFYTLGGTDTPTFTCTISANLKNK